MNSAKTGRACIELCSDNVVAQAGDSVHIGIVQPQPRVYNGTHGRGGSSDDGFNLTQQAPSVTHARQNDDGAQFNLWPALFHGVSAGIKRNACNAVNARTISAAWPT
jgi:hypothetical protein